MIKTIRFTTFHEIYDFHSEVMTFTTFEKCLQQFRTMKQANLEVPKTIPLGTVTFSKIKHTKLKIFKRKKII